MEGSAVLYELESFWQNLKRQQPHGLFDYSVEDESFGSIVKDHFRQAKLANSYGVYIVWRHANQEILYIGKSGTIDRQGRFGKQDLPGRLTNRRGNISSEAWFYQMAQAEGKLLIEYVTLLPVPQSPALVEATLLQAYLNARGHLPPYNKSL